MWYMETSTSSSIVTLWPPLDKASWAFIWWYHYFSFMLSLRTSQNHPAETSRSLKTDPSYSQNFSGWTDIEGLGFCLQEWLSFQPKSCHLFAMVLATAEDLPRDLWHVYPWKRFQWKPGNSQSLTRRLNFMWRTWRTLAKTTASWAKDARLWRVESWDLRVLQAVQLCRLFREDQNIVLLNLCGA